MSTTMSGRPGLITGAGRGIGAATARRLAADGARLVLADVNSAAVEELAAEIAEAGGEATAVGCDVSDYAQVEAAVERCVAAYGDPEIVLANAGLANWCLMSDGDPEEWRRLVEVNLLGIAFTVRAVLPGMKQRGAGRLVLMSSIAGREAWIGEPVYIAAKHAVIGLGRSLMLECEEHGIGVTLIEPGAVDTELVRATEQGKKELEEAPSLKPEEVADAIAYALSSPPGVRVDELQLRAIGPVG